MMDIKSVSLNEVRKPFVSENKSFDPDKRIDINQKWDIKTNSLYDVDKRVDVTEKEVNGGAYSDVFTSGEGKIKEVHHMPSAEASFLEFKDSPAIKMDKADHRQTSSCGNSREAREYRKAQKDLIDNGSFRQALQMDINDVSEKFPGKYDDAISEMSAYVDKLEMEGKI